MLYRTHVRVARRASNPRGGALSFGSYIDDAKQGDTDHSRTFELSEDPLDAGLDVIRTADVFGHHTSIPVSAHSGASPRA